MKSKSYIILLFPLFFSGCLENKTTIPNYSLSNDTINFGKMIRSDTFKAHFFVRNNTEEELKILHIENGCGCTSGVISDSLVPANDSSRIQLLYIPSLTKDRGNVTKYITVRTDAQPPFKNIIIKGEVTE